jgi:SAM-dependent methyltransferase
LTFGGERLPGSTVGALERSWNRLTRSIVMRGWRTTLKGVAATIDDYWFDLRFGTDTARRVELAALDIPSENKARGIGYTPTHSGAFRALIDSLSLPNNSVLVDLGCGKGKVLLLAAGHRFRRIVGVEFSRQLCAVARRNVERFRKLGAISTEVDVLERDAAQYEVGADENVFFMFHPFDAVVMSRVMRNIQESLEQHRRAIWIIYNNPVCRGVIERSAGFVEAGTHVFGSTHFGIYVNRAGGGVAPAMRPVGVPLRTRA